MLSSVVNRSPRWPTKRSPSTFSHHTQHDHSTVNHQDGHQIPPRRRCHLSFKTTPPPSPRSYTATSHLSSPPISASHHPPYSQSQPHQHQKRNNDPLLPTLHPTPSTYNPLSRTPARPTPRPNPAKMDLPQPSTPLWDDAGPEGEEAEGAECLL